MAGIGRNLSEVDTATGACAKPNCKTGSRMLHRHHRRHEAMWIGIWVSRRLGEEKYNDFVARYHDFNPADWVRLCDHHHAEIHLIYDHLINKDKTVVLKPLSQYSWKQAEKLMAKLEAACFDWLKKDTPGIASDKLDYIRARRAAQPHLPSIRRIRIPSWYYKDD